MFFKFCREHNVSPSSKDIKEIIRGWDEWLHTLEVHEEIAKKKKELEEKWNEGYTGGYKLIPDTRVFS